MNDRWWSVDPTRLWVDWKALFLLRSKRRGDFGCGVSTQQEFAFAALRQRSKERRERERERHLIFCWDTKILLCSKRTCHVESCRNGRLLRGTREFSARFTTHHTIAPAESMRTTSMLACYPFFTHAFKSKFTFEVKGKYKLKWRFSMIRTSIQFQTQKISNDTITLLGLEAMVGWTFSFYEKLHGTRGDSFFWVAICIMERLWRHLELRLFHDIRSYIRIFWYFCRMSRSFSTSTHHSLAVTSAHFSCVDNACCLWESSRNPTRFFWMFWFNHHETGFVSFNTLHI